MEMWTTVRRRVLTGELSKRAACREYDLHWATLEKILAHDQPPGYRTQTTRAKPKMGPVLPIIHDILQQDRTKPPKQRHTAKKIFDRLTSEHGFTGAYSTVRHAVADWKSSQKEVFVPLTHKPAHAQVDFGEATITLNGQPVKVAMFVMTLVHSDTIFCQVFPRECTETFQEGHVRAFEFFGGVPRRISYDNSKIAVRRIVGQRGRTPTHEFLRLQSHHLFEHHFCRVRRANEKGHVENLLGFARRNFLVPIPQVDSLEVLNESLTQQCRDDQHRTVRGETASKRELFENELTEFLPLPEERFEARRTETPIVNSESLARFDTNDYSVPTAFAHRQVIAIGGIETVRLLAADEVIATHPRSWDKHKTLFDPRHYLALLERKPGALDWARPLEDWALPECFSVLRRRQESDLDRLGTREFIRVLRLLETATLDELTAAVGRALAIQAHTADAIRLLLQTGREEPARWFRLDDRPHLSHVHLPPPNLETYTTLLSGGEV